MRSRTEGWIGFDVYWPRWHGGTATAVMMFACGCPACLSAVGRFRVCFFALFSGRVGAGGRIRILPLRQGDARQTERERELLVWNCSC